MDFLKVLTTRVVNQKFYKIFLNLVNKKMIMNNFFRNFLFDYPYSVMVGPFRPTIVSQTPLSLCPIHPSMVHPAFPRIERPHILYDQPIRRVESPRMLYAHPPRHLERDLKSKYSKYHIIR